MLAPPNDLVPPPVKPRPGPAKRGVLQDPPPGTPHGRPPGATPPVANEVIFHELMDRFSILAEQCARFSREVYGRAGALPQQDLERTIRRHLDLSRAIFSQYAIELLTILYFRGATSFRDIHKGLGHISPTVLVRRLTALERFGIVQRTVTGESAMDARYVLTHKGTVISRLGEPVMLYIRLAAGWFNEQPETVKGAVENPPAQ